MAKVDIINGLDKAESLPSFEASLKSARLLKDTRCHHRNKAQKCNSDSRVLKSRDKRAGVKSRKSEIQTYLDSHNVKETKSKLDIAKEVEKEDFFVASEITALASEFMGLTECSQAE